MNKSIFGNRLKLAEVFRNSADGSDLSVFDFPSSQSDNEEKKSNTRPISVRKRNLNRSHPGGRRRGAVRQKPNRNDKNKENSGIDKEGEVIDLVEDDDDVGDDKIENTVSMNEKHNLVEGQEILPVEKEGNEMQINEKTKLRDNCRISNNNNSNRNKSNKHRSSKSSSNNNSNSNDNKNSNNNKNNINKSNKYSNSNDNNTYNNKNNNNNNNDNNISKSSNN